MIKNLGIVIALTGVFLISGCESLTPEQVESNRRFYEAKERQEQQEYMAKLRTKCAAFGYSQGTDSFARCMQNEDRASQARDAESHEATLRAIRAYNCSSGVQSDCDNQPYRQITNCSRDIVGNVTCISQ